MNEPRHRVTPSVLGAAFAHLPLTDRRFHFFCIILLIWVSHPCVNLFQNKTVSGLRHQLRRAKASLPNQPDPTDTSLCSCEVDVFILQHHGTEWPIFWSITGRSGPTSPVLRLTCLGQPTGGFPGSSIFPLYEGKWSLFAKPIVNMIQGTRRDC